MTVTFKVVDGDVVVDQSSGRPVLITGREKLRQDLRQMLTQRRGANGFGAGLDDIVALVADAVVIQSEITRRIRRGAQVLQSLQDRFHANQRSPEERLSGIAALQVGQAVQDGQRSRTSYAFRVEFRSVAGLPTTLSGAVQQPN